MKEIQLLCMTFIDPEMGCFEIAWLLTIYQSSARISQILNEVCISRYHRPLKVIFNNCSKFKSNFIPLLKNKSVKPTCTAIKNSQANAIIDRIHQVASSMLNTKDLVNVTFEAVAPWSNILASIVYAVWWSYNSTLQATPVKLVFGRDMIVDINFQPNYK